MTKGTHAQRVNARATSERANEHAGEREVADAADAGASPTIRSLGHAGLLIEYRGCSLLCDPWMSESGAFLRSWHKYPPNDAIDRESLHSADFLYLSHRRFDHFDRAFLAAIPKQKITVIIADYVTDAFAGEIAELGFARIVRLADWKAYALADGFDIRLVRDPTLYTLASVALIRAGGMMLLNKNDCDIAKNDFVKFRGQNIDILFAQQSGAMWNSAARVDHDGKQRASTARPRKESIDAFVEMANGVNAKQVVCSAGRPCFLEDDRFHLNFSEHGLRLEQQAVFAEVAARISGRLHLVLPGDEIAGGGAVSRTRNAAKVGGGAALAVRRARAFDFANAEAFLREYQAQRARSIHAYLAALPPLPVGGVWQFRDFLRALFASSSHVRAKIGALVKFSVTGSNGGAVYVDTRQGAFKMSLVATGQPSFEFELASPIARLLIEREETWEDVLLSMRFRARHDTDLYNWPLFAILLYGHDAKRIRQVERVLSSGEGDSSTARYADAHVDTHQRQSSMTSLRDAALAPARSR